MAKCEICGKETEYLEECDYCGRLYCPDCGELFECDICFERISESEEGYHGCFF